MDSLGLCLGPGLPVGGLHRGPAADPGLPVGGLHRGPDLLTVVLLEAVVVLAAVALTVILLGAAAAVGGFRVGIGPPLAFRNPNAADGEYGDDDI